MKGRISLLIVAADESGWPVKLWVPVAMERKARTSQVATSHHAHDSYCVIPMCVRRLTESKKTCQTLNINSIFADHVSSAKCHYCTTSKAITDVSCADQLSFVQHVIHAPAVAPDLPVGVRLNQFWEIWASLADL